MEGAWLRVVERGRVRWVFVLGVALLMVGLSLMAGWGTQAQTPNRAGLVIQFGDNSVQTYCVEFTSPTINGYQMLQAVSSLQVIYDVTSTGFGAGVCKINNDGCTQDDCFCQCQSINCVYWSYFKLRSDDTWEYSNVGASSRVLENGSVDGWRWGAGSTSSAPPPPAFTFAQLCSTTGTATPTPTPTATTSGTPSVTPTRTQTPTPTFTPGVLQVEFAANPTTLVTNQCTIITWRVTGPWTAVFFDNAIVQPEEQRRICPGQTQTLTLRAEYAGGVETRTLTVQVNGNAAPTTAATTPFVASTTPPPLPTTPSPGATLPATVENLTPPTMTLTPTPSPAVILPTATGASDGTAATPTASSIAAPTAISTPADRVALVAQGEGTAAEEVPDSQEENVTLLLLQYLLFIVILGVLGIAGVFLLWRRSRLNDE